MRAATWRIWCIGLFAVILAVVAFNLPAQAGNYQVFAGNDLGMHCMDSDFSVFSVLPPGNSLNAQVIKKAPKGGNPRLLTMTETSIFYRGTKDTRGLINSTSIGKTNFWENVQGLFGVTLTPDVGFLGAAMPGQGNKAKPFASFNAVQNRFEVVGIPITDRADGKGGNFPLNPYNMMEILAKKPGGNGKLGGLKIVVPTATEMHCSECHATGTVAAFNGFHGVSAFSNNPNPELQYRENVLLLHDAIHATNLFFSQPVACAKCHYSAATEFLTTGKITLTPTGEQVGNPLLSPAMHLFHGSPQTGGVVPIPEAGITTCYKCHPGQSTQCMRGPMAQAGLVCQDCHGGLLAVGGAYPLKSTGQSRTPWIAEPQCQSCHTGDAISHLGNDLILNQAYDPLDPAATPVIATNKRFAETAILFRESTGHGGVLCSSCHGSPHAEWATNQPNDNLTANSMQGHPGMITECKVCHGKNRLPATTGGPHGLHNINESVWINAHPDFYDANSNNCKACHGLLLEGTVLSRAAADRSFKVEGKKVNIPKGTNLGCAICHESPLGGGG